MCKKSLYPIQLIIFLALAVFGLRMFILDVMRVEGHSMLPTLQPGQVIFVNRVSYGIILPLVNSYIVRWQSPKRGDVVVLPSPNQPKILVKRCVATAGDSIHFAQGKLFVREIAVGLSGAANFKFDSAEAVPDGFIMVIGDNAENSVDSRDFGFVSVDRIIGKAIGVETQNNQELK